MGISTSKRATPLPLTSVLTKSKRRASYRIRINISGLTGMGTESAGHVKTALML